MQIPAFCAEQGSGNKVPVKCDSIHPGTIIRSRKGRIMFCRKCGLKILPGAAFCSKCGEPVHTAEYCGGFWGITAEGKKDGTTVPSSFVQHAVPDSAGAGRAPLLRQNPVPSPTRQKNGLSQTYRKPGFFPTRQKPVPSLTRQEAGQALMHQTPRSFPTYRKPGASPMCR